ncbi:MAG TPA: hypothetical protein VFN99_11785 [Gaiella sp.]|nr:hypothetical protein [Gaiella sp.]
MNRIRLMLALVAALTAVTALVAHGAGAAPTDLGDDWQALQVTITGEGTVTGTGGYSCPDDYTDPNHCSKAYAYGSLVNLVADPAPGWLFGGWQGCDGVSGAICQMYLDTPEGGNHSVSVSFVKFTPTPTQHPLTVTVVGPGEVHGPGIACPGDCTQELIASSSVTLEAKPGSLATFTGWSGACTGGPQAACVVEMDAARSVTATFAANVPIGAPRTLTVTVAGSGNGSVTSGSTIDCPGDCSQSYSVAAEVTLTATSATGSAFAGWSGDCSGSSPTCTVTLSSSRTVMASFDKVPGGDPAPPANPGDPGPDQPGTPAPPGSPASEVACTIEGTRGDDVLIGTAGNDVICGLGGNDRLVGKGGLDLLLGGAGADLLVGGAGNDLLLGDAERDRLLGGAGRDRLYGGQGHDRLAGGRGSDRLLGGPGGDLLLARDHVRDRLDGGSGRDSARIDRGKDVKTRIEKVV